MLEDDQPSGNVREFILKHYGINAAEEKAKKEKRVGEGNAGREVPNVCSEHRPPSSLPTGHLGVSLEEHPQRRCLQVRGQEVQRDRQRV
jgi:hypothetical protein